MPGNFCYPAFCSNVQCVHGVLAAGLSKFQKRADLKENLSSKRDTASIVEGDRGAGARENRGREGYGRREKKGREAGVLRGREAGEQYKTVNFFTY